MIIPEIPEDFKQTPRYEVKVGSGNQKQRIYFTHIPNSTANAVITDPARELSPNKAQIGSTTKGNFMHQL
ncbi:MAG TPA: hypothetical protein DCL61_01780 [Cyanobacteria bacterium UBA12227]|nr:hypothetical protein [Cyanobacteria bacterium UBA12227]HAX88399.1 hypothetical protein [Cyanobacteria bacterium UBA11370]HBY81841.1 hypothetical protein [Cyanobacteria bacterium UBA11148]